MTLQQIEYAIALEKFKSFTKAAEYCYVTQPTLTMQIRKLEQELNTEIFDRSTSPIRLTKEGEIFIYRARNIMAEVRELNIELKSSTNLLEGEFRLGIIPTIAPYLLPIFLPTFISKYPNTKLLIQELQTQDLLTALREDGIDFGIAATPLNEKDIQEARLYEEPFLLYTNTPDKYHDALTPAELSLDTLLMLDEGHCFREQIISLCRSKAKFGTNFSFEYLAGSIEGLTHLVDQNLGETLIPFLARHSVSQPDSLIPFSDPVPAREISLLTHRRNNYRHLTNVLNDCIINNLPEEITKGKLSKKIIEWV